MKNRAKHGAFKLISGRYSLKLAGYIKLSLSLSVLRNRNCGDEETPALLPQEGPRQRIIWLQYPVCCFPLLASSHTVLTGLLQHVCNRPAARCEGPQRTEPSASEHLARSNTHPRFYSQHVSVADEGSYTPLIYIISSV